MPIVDPGLTTVDDNGKVILSPKAIPVLPPQQVDVRNVTPPLGNISNIQAPAPAANLPRISPADSQYGLDSIKDIIANPLNRADYEPQGARRVFNHIIGALAGMGQGSRGEPIQNTFQQLQDRKYDKAMAERATRLSELEPVARLEETERGRKSTEALKEAQLAETQRSKQESERIAGRKQTEVERENQERDTARANKIKNDIDRIKMLSTHYQHMDATQKGSIKNQYLNTIATSQDPEIIKAAHDALNEIYKLEAKEAGMKSDATIPAALARGAAYNQFRPVPVVDPKTGESTWKTAADAIKSGAQTPHNVSFQKLRADALASVPTSTSRTMAQMARTIEPRMEAITSQVDKLVDKIGPAVGRWNDLWVNKAGFDDRDFANLDQNLDLLASAIVRTHFGAKGGEKYQNALKKNFREAQSPEDLKGRIAAADGWILGYAGMDQGPKVNNPNKPKHDVSMVK